MKRERKSQEGANCIVFDAGRTYAKISVVTPSGVVLATRRILTPTYATLLYTAIDTDALFNWLLLQLKAFSAYAIDRIIPVAHGAACAFLDENLHLVQPVQDYETAIPPVFASAYARLRPAFSETLSPPLPKGLNLGAQIYWHAKRDPDMFAKVRWILPYPQYWSWRLSGALHSEISSLGCHTDLWSPVTGDFSSLTHDQGWAHRFAPLRKAWEGAGRLKPEIVRATGLSPATRVCVGLHDSGAALASLLGGWQQDTDLPALLSTGTWFIAMAPGGSLDGLQAERDCMGAVDVFGKALPCARFMGGRAFEMITHDGVRGGCTSSLDVDADTLAEVMHEAALALPSFLDAGGPYPGMHGEIRGLRHDTPRTRAALGMLYQALLSTTCLDMIQCGRTLLIEGMAAGNSVLAGLIAALHDGPVLRNDGPSGVTLGASALAYLGERPMPRLQHNQVTPLLPDEMRAYQRIWRDAINAEVAA
ncbi:hypothetical protein [Asticcacaulis sp. EMRT-3]|uniref:FGGY-family carbohydrate kinase n=1 Tax=Asticcacaulis sp. EMRT-3 TaxID=3040349 RepID=UPI0024AF47D1|nr:hypothetical protein [Asticcacaulis sp. EMRT-3]MDI7776419.1 hypothetical protein [Asticcacaulis sp. EMRT-3]